jgi:hypothetical protein
MDGFVNDVEPASRRGLHTREGGEMVAWDSVVGHHMGLSAVMPTFLKPFKRRHEDEVFEVHRHGIVHGMIVNYNNQIVATKAWNMLGAVADWATALQKAANPVAPKPSLKETWSSLTNLAAYRRYEKEFVTSTIEADQPGFADDDVVRIATEFLEAWKHGRWALVARFMPPILRASSSDGELAREAKNTFESYNLTDFEIASLTYDQASTAAISGVAEVNGERKELASGGCGTTLRATSRFRAVSRGAGGSQCGLRTPFSSVLRNCQPTVERAAARSRESR